MFMANRFKKLTSLFILTVFSSTLLGSEVVLAGEIPKGTKALIQIEQEYIGKNLKAGEEIQGRLVNDVKVNGRTIVKAGTPSYFVVKEAESSRFAGNGGIIQLENGSVYTNNSRYLFDFKETITGKEKEWVKVTMSTGVILFPLLLAGLVKGGQAEIPANKIYEIEFNGYSYELKNL